MTRWSISNCPAYVAEGLPRTTIELVGETGEPNTSTDMVNDCTCFRSNGSASRRCHPADNRNKKAAEVKLGLRNLAYNMERYCSLIKPHKTENFIEKITERNHFLHL